jgi:hypothetical protein
MSFDKNELDKGCIPKINKKIKIKIKKLVQAMSN